MNATTKISTRKINSALNAPTETNKERINQACLRNATQNESELNYARIMEGFAQYGIAEDCIIPRINVFTKFAWEALGYRVRPSELVNGVMVETMRFYTDKASGEAKAYMKKTKVYHIAQVVKLS